MPYHLWYKFVTSDVIVWDDVWPRQQWPENYVEMGGNHGVRPDIEGPIPYMMTGGELQPGGVLPDIMRGRWLSDLILSYRVIKMIQEAGEVAQHHYIPLDLTLLDGARIEGQYFLFVAGDLIDGVVPESSNLIPKFINNKFKYYAFIGDSPDVCWRESAIRGRHIWVDKYLPRQVFVSDAFAKILNKNNIKKYLLHPSVTLAGNG